MNTILYNGKIITMNKRQPYAEAVAISGNKIAKVGSNKDVLALKDKNTSIIDLEGKSLLPGFNDSHMHLVNFANALNMIDLVGSTSIDEVVKRAKDYIQKDSNSVGWVKGRGWNQELFSEKRLLNRYDLDKISTEHPIFLTRACGHMSVVNSKALELLNINKNTPQVEGGHFDMDENNKPTGVFRENALGLIYDNLPAPTVEEIKRMIQNACDVALKDGITSIQTDDFDTFSDRDFKKIIQAYQELVEEGELPLRIYEQCLLQSRDRLSEFLDLGYKTGYGDEFFKIGPLKLLADGSLGARTAYLSHSYEDDPTTCGLATLTQQELDELVSLAHKKGMQIAIHCIGDKIMDMAFNSIEKALNEYPKTDHRHGVVHCQITNKKLLDRFKANNGVAYIQPIFLDSDIPIVEKRIGKERAKESYNFKTLIEMGVHTPYGSDCPVEPFNVLNGLYCAVTRKTLSGLPDNGWLPEQKVSIEEALYAFTKEGAYASFEETIKGSIEEGMLADLVVLNRDILSTPEEEIKNIKVDMVLVDGKIKFKRV